MANYEAPRHSHQREAEEKKKGKKKWLLLLLLLLLLFSILIGICVYMVFFRVQLTPDYAPQLEDANAEAIIGDDEAKLDKPEGGGAVGLTYMPDVTIDLSDERATFMFQNPNRSNSDIVLQIVVQDEILAQSGKLVPGKQLTSMDLLSGAANKLSVGGYNGKFVILFYDPISAERSVLKSEGAITITVVE